MIDKRGSFKSGKLMLEGVFAAPEGAGAFPAVIVCHPHPLYGGSMDNNVVDAIFRALIGYHLAAFKFNFRGTGGSEGEFTQGVGEREDIEAAIHHLEGMGEVDRARLGLAGYSAGAGFSFPVGCLDKRIKALAAVSPPLGMFNFDALKTCLKPKLLLSGSQDIYVPEHLFTDFARSLPEPREYEVFKGVDHFWWGYEEAVGKMVADFFARALKA